MLVKFLCPDWRDTAYLKSSEEGSGSYEQEQVIESEVEDITSLMENEYLILDNYSVLYFLKRDVSVETATVKDCVITFNSERD